MRPYVQIGASDDAVDVLALRAGFAKTGVGRLVDPKPQFARQGQVHVAVAVDRQALQPVQRIIALCRIAKAAPILRPAGQVIAFARGALASRRGRIAVRYRGRRCGALTRLLGRRARLRLGTRGKKRHDRRSANGVPQQAAHEPPPAVTLQEWWRDRPRRRAAFRRASPHRTAPGRAHLPNAIPPPWQPRCR